MSLRHPVARTVKKCTLTLCTLFLSYFLHGQTARGEFIQASIGYGMSAPYDDVDILGDGFYAQGEYVLNLKSWLSLRPYAGVILVKTSDKNSMQREAGYEISANAFLLGGKARVIAPIPWVAPYVEGGIGTSLGSFVTNTGYTDLKKSGMLWHIPFSFGLLVGRHHNFDIGFVYYFHPSAEQYSGAFAVGMSFALD
ncbi:hypothetical protein [Sinomicrobium oceani]|uniref:hypothetical protein n=1 Tax=Sinomicrobium oceani TaxID=1150368 RepID=UPI00227BFC8C|nr:hypothetical protein [Sinomicrobium oceani]